MGALKLAYYENELPLKVAYSKTFESCKVMQGWLSLDPLQAKYPSLSPYNFVGNSPIYKIEVDGRYFTGNTATLKAVYAIACQLSKDNVKAAAFKAAIEKMDASDIEFNINIESATNYRDGSHGTTEFDFKNNRVVLNANSYIFDGDYAPVESNLAHELEHGRQFMEGEIDFFEKADESSAGNAYDKTDEYRAIDVGAMVKEQVSFDETTPQEIKNQKEEYSRTRPDGDFKASQETTEGNLTEKGKKMSKSTDYKSKFNYKPTEKQTSEKKSILK